MTLVMTSQREQHRPRRRVAWGWARLFSSRHDRDDSRPDGDKGKQRRKKSVTRQTKMSPQKREKSYRKQEQKMKARWRDGRSQLKNNVSRKEKAQSSSLVSGPAVWCGQKETFTQHCKVQS
eukprot:6207277-Pleurochrysis_carterae.AAC.3